MSVDLPVPLRPSKPMRSPLSMARLMFSSKAGLRQVKPTSLRVNIRTELGP